MADEARSLKMPSEVGISQASAGTLADALRRRHVSSLELTDAYIARIERLDKSINAVVVRDFDRARDGAKAADIALGRGEDGPLLGAPMTVKEAHNVSGLPTTWAILRSGDGLPRRTPLRFRGSRPQVR